MITRTLLTVSQLVTPSQDLWRAANCREQAGDEDGEGRGGRGGGTCTISSTTAKITMKQMQKKPMYLSTTWKCPSWEGGRLLPGDLDGDAPRPRPR